MPNIKELKRLYDYAKKSSKGDEVICPSCKTKFIKVNNAQAFCKTQGGTICKDFYWNNVTPSKRNNRTRISPASASWLLKQEENRDKNYDPDDDMHPFDSYSLGQD